jgi:branched-chain amino acid transport system substrate-binding protein
VVVGGASVAARDLARRYPDTVFVSTFWDEQEITLRRPAPNLFRFSPDYGQQAAGLGEHAYRTLGWRRVAVVAGDSASGWGGSAAFVAEFCALGGTVVETA